MLAAVFSSMVNLFYTKIMHSEYNENNSYSVRFIRLSGYYATIDLESTFLEPIVL